MSEDALIVITSAIKTAFIRKAGYSVTKVEDQNAPKPKGE